MLPMHVLVPTTVAWNVAQGLLMTLTPRFFMKVYGSPTKLSEESKWHLRMWGVGALCCSSLVASLWGGLPLHKAVGVYMAVSSISLVPMAHLAHMPRAPLWAWSVIDGLAAVISFKDIFKQVSRYPFDTACCGLQFMRAAVSIIKGFFTPMEPSTQSKGASCMQVAGQPHFSP